MCTTKQATRYQKIDEIGKQISALGSSKGDHIFRLTMMKSSRLLNESKASVDQGTTSVSVTSSVQPPKRKTGKCGRLPKQPQNQSRLCQVFRSQPKHQVDKAAEKSADRSSGITMIEAASNSGGQEGELKNDVIIQQINNAMHVMLAYEDEYKTKGTDVLHAAVKLLTSKYRTVSYLFIHQIWCTKIGNFLTEFDWSVS